MQRFIISVGDEIKVDGQGYLESYNEESYQLEVNKDNKVSTRTFVYSGDITNFNGFLFYDDSKNKYAVNDKGEIISSSNLESFNLGSGTFIRRIGLNEGEIGKTQDVKNDERIVYIAKNALVNNKLLSYTTDTLEIIQDSNNPSRVKNYYVEFSDSKGNETQLVINSTLSTIIYQEQSDPPRYSVVKIEDKIGVNFDVKEGDNIVYAYRSVDVVDSEFKDNITLLGVHISSGVEKINNFAFNGCSNLTRVEIPNSVTTIGWSAFNGCSSLRQVKIPNNVETIDANAFSGCSILEQVIISNGVKNIETNAFNGCKVLKQIEIPDSVETIGSYAFDGCTSLTQVTIPNSVKSIGGGIFSGCINLTQVDISINVEAINDFAFYNCNKLETITIRGTLTIVIPNAFMTNGSTTLIIRCNETTKNKITEAINGAYNVSFLPLE